jgi:pseudouridine-5'-monophosphatase
MLLARPVTHVVFDMDGVLLDTERLYTEATQRICDRFGKTFDWSVKGNMIGRPALDSARYLVATLALPITPEDYLAERAALFETLMPTAAPMPGARALTRALAAAGAGLAVASSSSRALFELKTTRHRDWFAEFPVIVLGDDPRVRRGKPAPDIFLVAAAALGVEPARCVVVEDAPAGVEAAHAAGMQVVAVPDPGMDRARFATADVVVGSLAEVAPADLGFVAR